MEIDVLISTNGLAYGAMGAFVFEMVWLRSELESRRTKKKTVIALLPLWVLAGSLVGGVVGLNSIDPIYVFLSGGVWRKIAENSGRFVSNFMKAASSTAEGN